jgi:hypothetical protein
VEITLSDAAQRSRQDGHGVGQRAGQSQTNEADDGRRCEPESLGVPYLGSARRVACNLSSIFVTSGHPTEAMPQLPSMIPEDKCAQGSFRETGKGADNVSSHNGQ